MEETRLKSLLESLIFVAESPLKTGEILKAIRSLERAEAKAALEGEEGTVDAVADGEITTPAEEESDASDQLQAYADEESDRTSKPDIQQTLTEIQKSYEEDDSRGIRLVEVAGGWQFRTRAENAAVVRHLYQPKPTRLSKPGMETLSIVAYRQPLTRPEIDDIRGVDTGGVLKTLCEKNLVRIVGKRDEPGKPMLYGTTHEFLELFQLKSLKELPGLRDYRDLEAEFRKQTDDEGVITENEAFDAEEEKSILELSEGQGLEPLSDEEEKMLGSLEENIKDVRHLEKEIFQAEKKEEEAAAEAAKPEAPAPSSD